MIETYLFDLDGTLTDSGKGIMNAAKYALEKMDVRIPSEDVLRKFIGPPLWESFEKFIGLSKEDADKAVKLYREYYSETCLFENDVYDGIPELLEKLKADGKQLAVATSKPEVFTERILAHFGLDKYFDSVTGSLLDGTRKNKDEVIACALQRCGSPDVSKVIMVGDRMHDIDGAKKLGIGCIAVMFGYGSREEFESHGAVFIADTPDDILKYDGERKYA